LVALFKWEIPKEMGPKGTPPQPWPSNNTKKKINWVKNQELRNSPKKGVKNKSQQKFPP